MTPDHSQKVVLYSIPCVLFISVLFFPRFANLEERKCQLVQSTKSHFAGKVAVSGGGKHLSPDTVADDGSLTPRSISWSAQQQEVGWPSHAASWLNRSRLRVSYLLCFAFQRKVNRRTTGWFEPFFNWVKANGVCYWAPYDMNVTLLPVILIVSSPLLRIRFVRALIVRIEPRTQSIRQQYAQ